MSQPFVQEFRVRWPDVDFNQHMRNAAYLGCAEDTRMRYLDANGWTMERFAQLRIGPVVLEDRITYRKELRLLEPFRVDLELAGAAEGAARLRLRNRFFRVADGALCASVDSLVLWLDLAGRRPVAPPADLRDIWLALPSTEDFEPIPPTPARRGPET